MEEVSSESLEDNEIMPKAAARMDEPTQGDEPRYGVMYYKKDNSVAVRRRFGAREQCMSFGGKTCRLDERALREFAEVAVQQLDRGIPEETVKAWGKAQVQQKARGSLAPLGRATWGENVHNICIKTNACIEDVAQI